MPEYGVEKPGDYYPPPCVGSFCQLARLNESGFCCPGDPGACRLTAKTDRSAQCSSIYLDNRRGILHTMCPENQLTVTVSSGSLKGLPDTDPVTIGLASLKPYDDGKPPSYIVRAEGMAVDGPYNLTLRSLLIRLDGRPRRPRPPKQLVPTGG